MTNEEGGIDPEEALFEVLVDRVNTTAAVWLGLTVGCARCHDHKFDPIPQKDFYALQGFLQSSTYRQVCFDTLEHNRRVAETLHALRRKDGPRLVKALVAAQRHALEKLPEYLLAAREALLPGPRWADLNRTARFFRK